MRYGWTRGGMQEEGQMFVIGRRTPADRDSASGDPGHFSDEALAASGREFPLTRE